MRRILAFLLTVALMVGLVACGQAPEVAEPTEPATMPALEPVKKTVHILVPESMASMTAELANLFTGADMVGTTATYTTVEEQTQLLNDIAAQSKGNGSDVVVTMPMSQDMDEAFANLLEANVAYALADIIPAGAKAASVANVFYNQYEIGAAAAAYLTEKGMTQNDKVMIMQGITQEEAQRTEGFQMYLQGKMTANGAAIETPWDSLDNLVYSDMQGANREGAKVYFETYMSESDHAATKYIAAWEDSYALGILDALENGEITDTIKQNFLSGGPILIGCGEDAEMANVISGTSSSYTCTMSFGEIRAVRYSRELLTLAAQAMADHLAGTVVEQDQPQPITWIMAETAVETTPEGE